MKRNQKLNRNLNVSIEYFNGDNFEYVNLLKKIDPNKYSKLLKPKVSLEVTGVFKKIKLDKTFTMYDLYDLIFLIKLNKDYTVDSVYLHYGNINKIYLNI